MASQEACLRSVADIQGDRVDETLSPLTVDRIRPKGTTTLSLYLHGPEINLIIRAQLTISYTI
jgi:hypothetical protein